MRVGSRPGGVRPTPRRAAKVSDALNPNIMPLYKLIRKYKSRSAINIMEIHMQGVEIISRSTAISLLLRDAGIISTYSKLIATEIVALMPSIVSSGDPSAAHIARAHVLGIADALAEILSTDVPSIASRLAIKRDKIAMQVDVAQSHVDQVRSVVGWPDEHPNSPIDHAVLERIEQTLAVIVSLTRGLH